MPKSDPAEEPRNVFRREQVFNILAHKFIVVPADHFPENRVRIDNAWTLICNNHTLIECLQNVSDLCDPLGL